jgi:hypothetical protein
MPTTNAVATGSIAVIASTGIETRIIIWIFIVVVVLVVAFGGCH